MQLSDRPIIGYVVKRYPRLSETFILNEILAHEAAGLSLEIFSLRAPSDSRFQDALGRVQAHVHYLPAHPVKAEDLWGALCQTSSLCAPRTDIFEIARSEAAIDVYQALHLARLAHHRGVGHLHAHFATSSATVTRLASLLTGIPYSFTAHAKDIFHESVSEDDLRNKLRDASSVVTVSDYNVSYLRGRFGDDAASVTRIYNGLDLSNFEFQSPHDRPPLIVGIGRLVEKKGFVDLVDACAELIRRGQDIRCEIIGDGELRSELEGQIQRLGVGDRVILRGSQPNNVVREAMRRAAVLAAPCVVGEDGNRDGLPTVLIEAMALGTPCVSTDVTGIPEIVRHDETGLLAPQHDPSALADALSTLVRDRDLRCRLAAAGRELVEADFDIDRNTAAMRELFATSPAMGRFAAEAG